jgi:hypothetical protein
MDHLFGMRSPVKVLRRKNGGIRMGRLDRLAMEFVGTDRLLAWRDYLLQIGSEVVPKNWTGD